MGLKPLLIGAEMLTGIVVAVVILVLLALFGEFEA